MLRMAAVAAAMAMGLASRELRPPIDTALAAPAPASAACAGERIVTRGEPSTGRALTRALDERGLRDRGKTWLGPLTAVGGGRDALIYVPDELDPARTVELVVYLEGHGSFAADAMDHRHAASIARLRARTTNIIYVAPDAPSSTHGDRKARTPYWRAGCGGRRCAGGHAAPGDFVAFVEQARDRAAAMACVDPAALDLRLHLVGFSNGGKGVRDAIGQLAAVDFDVADRSLPIGDVVVADGSYNDAWLADIWAALAPRPEAPRLTILVSDGPFTPGASDPGAGNRRRAAAFWRRVAPDARAPGPGRAAEAPRLRLVPLRASHHGIGDAGVDYLAVGGAPAGS